MIYDDLESFKNWWVQNRPFNIPQNDSLFFDAINFKDVNTRGLVLYRQYPYQVQLFIIDPNSEIQSHVHPNVDNVEMYLTGDIDFFINDNVKIQNNEQKVTHDTKHRAKIGEKGGAFLSFQKWLNNTEMTCIVNDWKNE